MMYNKKVFKHLIWKTNIKAPWMEQFQRNSPWVYSFWEDILASILGQPVKYEKDLWPQKKRDGQIEVYT